MLGISTCWWRDRENQGDEILSDILELGFDRVELEYRITDAIYRQMRPRLGKALQVLSIHNYFPKPEVAGDSKASGDFFLLSSPDRDERSLAVKYSIRTIEHAHDMEVRAVVLHLGRVDMPNPMPKISGLLEDGKEENPDLMSFLEEQRRVRETTHGKHLDAVLFSLEKLNREAEKKGIFLGIENRYHFHEMPDYEEIGVILKEFQGGHIRYWHDMGHAQVQENMGITLQKDLLEAYSEMLIGVHFHDVQGLDDHFAPGQGEMNFEEIKPFLKSAHIKILEVHPKAGRKELIEGTRLIKDLGIE